MTMWKMIPKIGVKKMQAMKNIFKSMMLLAAAATAFTACNKEVDTQEPGKTGEMTHIRFSAVVNDTETKATLTTEDEKTFKANWEVDDEMAIEALSLDADYDEWGIASWNGTYFDLDILNSEVRGEWTYSAYYPAKENIAFGSARTQEGSAYNSLYDVMKGDATFEDTYLGKDDSEENMVIPMTRLTSILYFHLKSDLDEPLVSATLTVEGGDIAADAVAINNGALEIGDGSNTITITFEEGTAPNADDFCLWFNILPVQVSKLTLTVSTETKTATITNTKGKTYAAGKVNKVVKSGLEWENAPFFYESFDKFSGSGGNDEEGWSGSIAGKEWKNADCDNSGWSVENANEANACGKFGASGKLGSAITPAFNVTSNLATLTFNAAAWDGADESTDLLVSIASGTGILSESSITLAKGAWTEYTVYIAGAGDGTKVKFAAKNASKNRFFLDEVKVVEGGNAFDYLIVPSLVTASFDETSASFEIKTGSAWTITGAENVEIDKTSGNGNATVTLSFPVNGTASDITIATLTVTAGEKTATVTIKQAGDPNAIEELTIAEFLAKEVGDAYYRLTGTLTDLENTTYGNFTLVDETGSVYVYGLTKTKVTSNDKSFEDIGVVEGDIVTLEGKRAVHNDTPQVGGPAYYISHVPAPSLSVNPKELVFAAEGGSKTVAVTANNFGDGLTITAVSNNSQFTATVSSSSTITVAAAENTGNEVKTGEITVTATDGTNTKTAKIDVSQNKPAQPAQDGDILWQEDFTGYGTTMPATATGNHVFGGGTVSYTLYNGGSDTKLYDANLAGGAAPELLVGKSTGSFKISGIPTGGIATMTLTYRINNDYCVISVSDGITLRSDVTYENKVKTVYLIVPEGVASFDLEFKNTNSNNCRVDNFMLKAGAPKVKESQTITFGDNKYVEWVVGTDCILGTPKQGLTVTGNQTTVTYQSSNTEVATVDNTGMVTPIKAGTVFITATAVETDDYKEATDQYTLKITKAGGQTVSTKINHDFSFDTIGSDGWTNSYASHTVDYDESTVTFTAHSKQTSTITDVPVGKGAEVTLVLKEGTMSSAKFVCKQWGSKAQTITLHYSLNGGTSYTTTGVTSTNFTISSDELPEGTNAVKITFSSSSNQVGVASAEFTHVTLVE